MTTKLPEMKREVAVRAHDGSTCITFYSTTDALPDIQRFGTVVPFSSQREKYFLYVDGRYDFGEVLAYLRSYGDAE